MLPLQCPIAQMTAEQAYAAREAPFGVEPSPLERVSGGTHPGTEGPSLIQLLKTALDASAWDFFSRGSAMRRAGRAGFARSVCVALGNWGSQEAVPVLADALSDPEPWVRSHAA